MATGAMCAATCSMPRASKTCPTPRPARAIRATLSTTSTTSTRRRCASTSRTSTTTAARCRGLRPTTRWATASASPACPSSAPAARGPHACSAPTRCRRTTSRTCSSSRASRSSWFGRRPSTTSLSSSTTTARSLRAATPPAACRRSTSGSATTSRCRAASTTLRRTHARSERRPVAREAVSHGSRSATCRVRQLPKHCSQLSQG
mmetsp:Transcript_3389/g.10584  ORF Transcript_3389/g.10584 Transcript_3389/m.10584 type:complete len:205 (+) Transcript_3389:274-888(+)